MNAPLPTLRRLPYLLFVLLFSLDVASYLLDKIASHHAATGGEGWHFYLTIATQPWIWLAFALAPLQLWTWTRILRGVDLSLAYPITSMSYPLTMVAACIGLGERVDWRVWLGAILITVGVGILGGHTPREAAPAIDPAMA